MLTLSSGTGICVLRHVYLIPSPDPPTLFFPLSLPLSISLSLSIALSLSQVYDMMLKDERFYPSFKQHPLYVRMLAELDMLKEPSYRGSDDGDAGEENHTTTLHTPHATSFTYNTRLNAVFLFLLYTSLSLSLSAESFNGSPTGSINLVLPPMTWFSYSPTCLSLFLCKLCFPCFF